MMDRNRNQTNSNKKLPAKGCSHFITFLIFVIVYSHFQDDRTSDIKRYGCCVDNTSDHLHWETIRERVIRAGTLQKLVVNFYNIIVL